MSVSLHVAGDVSGDDEWLVGELRSFDRFFGTDRKLFPNESDEQVITRLRGLQSLGPWLIARNSAGDRTGFIAGVEGRHPYNREIRTLCETFWWVPERYRGTRSGGVLFSAFKSYGIENADWVVMTLEEKSPVKSETLTVRGFRPYERSFLFEVAQ